jgi:MFS transporter, FSR family, fosmidomycin resistance protein
MNWLLPLLMGLAHGVSDASAGLLVGLLWGANLSNAAAYILLYNGLAFALQPVAGLLLDRLNQPRRGAALGLLCTALGLLASTRSLIFGVMLVGIGSAFLHAGGGAVAIQARPGRAAQIGLFAAFGVIGLSLGTLASAQFSLRTVALFVAALLFIAGLIWFWKPPFLAESHPLEMDPFSHVTWTMSAILVMAIALRSLAWTGTQTSQQVVTALQLALAAGTGKLLGGFLADRFGWRSWSALALTGALGLLAFGATWGAAVMIGVALLQSLTPLSIAAMARRMPNSPALASALTNGLGVMLGGIAFFFLPRGWFNAAVLFPAVALSGLLYVWGLTGCSGARDGALLPLMSHSVGSAAEGEKGRQQE